MIKFVIRDRNSELYDSKRSNEHAGTCPVRLVQRKGHLFELGSGEVELFEVRVMAEAMDRRRRTLIEYEKQSWFPRPMYKMPNSLKRWYSGVQVLNVHRVVWLRHGARKNGTMDRKRFFDEIKSVFYADRLIVNEAGEFIQ